MKTQKNHSRKRKINARYSAPEVIIRRDQVDLILNCQCAYCSGKLDVFGRIDSNIGLEMHGANCPLCEVDFWVGVDNGEVVDVSVRRKLQASRA